MDLSANPVCAFFCDCLLSEFIAQLHFKFGAVETAFPGKARNIELTLFLGRLLADECGRSKNKSDFVNMLQLFLQFLIGIDRKASGGDGDLATLANGLLQIITNSSRDVINHLHAYTSHAFCLK